MPLPFPPLLEAALTDGRYDEILAAVLHYFDCQAGTIHLLEEGQLRLRAHQGLPPQIVEAVRTVPVGKGIAGLAAERRQPITICNLQTDESGQARPAAKATGMEGSLGVPMLATDGEMRGVLGIAKATAYDWNEEETALALAIGVRIAELHS